MTLLLEYRDKIKKFYRMNSVVILPILRFMLAFFALNGVNTMMGYMPRLDNIAIVMIASLACSFLPAGCLVLLCVLFSLGHMYALSLDALLIGTCMYLLLFLLLLRFAPRDSYVVILTPLMFALKMPYVIPVAVGLLGSPLSAISVAVGVLVYYLLGTIVGSASTITTMGEKEYLEKIRFLLEAIMKNKPALVIAGAFAATVIVIYLLRRLSVEHAWTIAMVAGAMINLVLLLVGDLKYNINLSMGGAIFGSILAVLVGKVIEFFRFCVDYGRTEWVQFEDDDYYYYVKALPKMNIAEATKTVKRINTNTQSIAPVGERTRSGGDGTRVASTIRPGAQSRERVREESRTVTSRTSGSRMMEQEENEFSGETRAMPTVRAQSSVRTDGRGRIDLSGADARGTGSRTTRPGTQLTSGSGRYGMSRPGTGSAGSSAGTAVNSRGGQTVQASEDEDLDDYEELF